ncbi:Holliday junction resolvase RuvX [Coxiella endosymbiont of Amblyomma americanum]|uniref:Holliday junction resolvase RuvX n=1 Tax=Coxiella endosymbiont of Amblyomma americanum TaxID=325775 RepID=UPI00057ECD34|nr:Holliday junction resolvase RuvX [Coxiella endosymbiont of Amblyomma americanum]AJC50678.1 Holliday junction resolvase [Coxiella endosymbiont of Amblyomma americanum]AUJ59002.1 Holliday junction resolvase RuvX [Coxiella-like endosymbiont of Amblyomma americanum]
MVKFSHCLALGFDFGLKRIGVAVGQTFTRSANPNTVLKSKNGVPDWKQVKKIIKMWAVNILVVGIPYNMDDTKQYITCAARKFADELQLNSGLPVHTVDECFTTVEAKKLLWFDQKFKKKRKRSQQLDSYAAKIILEQWLQENAY